jgi:hypothetical protein
MVMKEYLGEEANDGKIYYKIGELATGHWLLLLALTRLSSS